MNTERTASGAASFLRYNPERDDYSVTEEELERLRQGGQNIWKDLCLVNFSLGIPCLLNGIGTTGNPATYTFTNITLALFLNYLFGTIGIILTIVFGITWIITAKRFSKLIQVIKNKQRFPVQITQSSEGSGQVVSLESKSTEQPL